MIRYEDEIEHGALVRFVREAHMEVFPTSRIEQDLAALEPGAYVAVTCSPSKGVQATLDLTLRLSGLGFNVVPHIAARMVRDRNHLAEIMARLLDMPLANYLVTQMCFDPQALKELGAEPSGASA